MSAQRVPQTTTSRKTSNYSRGTPISPSIFTILHNSFFTKITLVKRLLLQVSITLSFSNNMLNLLAIAITQRITQQMKQRMHRANAQFQGHLQQPSKMGKDHTTLDPQVEEGLQDKPHHSLPFLHLRVSLVCQLLQLLDWLSSFSFVICFVFKRLCSICNILLSAFQLQKYFSFSLVFFSTQICLSFIFLKACMILGCLELAKQCSYYSISTLLTLDSSKFANSIYFEFFLFVN